MALARIGSLRSVLIAKEAVRVGHRTFAAGAGQAGSGAPNKDVERRALRQFVLGAGKSAGRNSSGRITVFHRGGGSKRLQRRIDLKRSTSSMGIVERIEYDPNRSSRIALVRWIEGVTVCQRKLDTVAEFAPPRKILEPTTTTIRGQFPFSSLPGMVDQMKVASFSPGPTTSSLVVGPPTRMSPSSNSASYSKDAGSKKTCARDVFFSALSSPNPNGETASLSFGNTFGLPRVAVAGAKPAFFASRTREELGEKNTFSLSDVRKWRPNSVLWTHRIKRKAALSWQSISQQDTLGPVGATEHNESKPKTEGKPIVEADRAPVTYIIASQQLEPGKMVMNCDWSRPSKVFGKPKAIVR
ncbi:60S ribosomal protein L2 [Hibiscus syriacus]|uniref:60S ribosomal protein L2, mitochondrial n=1 Tax=Hibiscus syriacus TaxID=106335 RepID=A0A6A3BNN1_HIBSY|nr:60S ribosomal protein L2, mitochondrial-like [Hibiscus syriacus]KAE8718194.1 60S ribosomal protein L2 [Hibiscus syriacus]